ncbi:hypothetical protein B0H67DRAFT_679798 [Lasiosphaeris hirsuta]|uniref:Zn(2)-C6 fungal-type domain-containing protein n=1 Tax=Lasiosphaeris hirsuta TaxID=260670 RepID=A0AA40E3W1_9PEZI|nr:hypothetical protein B0H67DRAFT_679798 [Lasiosphaeris hirsuta]
MVGVPGRSKACTTCKKRRKGCDLQRPVCGRCRKGGLVCEGYARPRAFINWAPPKGAPLTVGHTTEIVLSHGLMRSAYEEKLLGLHWETYLPNGRDFCCSAEICRILGGWTTVVRELIATDTLLKKSVLALCLTTVARRDGVVWMAEQGLSAYISGLQEMAAALQVPSRARSDALLCAAKMFSLYEAIHGIDRKERDAQAKSWLTHCHGEISIVRLGGPSRYQFGRAHRLFADGRLHQISVALRTRKRSFLADAEWKILPWKWHPKTIKDTLLDIIADTTELLEELDALNACSNPDDKEWRRVGLAEKCWLLDRALVAWQASSMPTLAELGEQAVAASDDSVSADALAAAHIPTLYSTACLIVYTTLAAVVEPYVVMPARTNPKTHCRDILSGVPIFFHPAVGTFRAHLATLPIAVVLAVINMAGPGVMEEERRLLRGILARPEAAGIGRLLHSMQV